MNEFYKPQNDIPKFFGDRRLKAFIKKKKDGKNLCVYCGENASTREHLPTKGIFESLEGLELMVLPACNLCNNNFSEHEKYFVCYIDYLKSIAFYNYDLREKTNKIFNRYPYIKEKIKDQINLITDDEFEYKFDADAFEIIIQKIAKGHLAYEFSDIFLGDPVSFAYEFIFELSKEEKLNFNSDVISDVVPEIGSRMLNQLLITIEGEVLYHWKTVKYNNYRYLVFINSKHRGVRFVVNEVLYCELLWE